jgi:uncharacterized protein YndB with AHSA1/START domain
MTSNSQSGVRILGSLQVVDGTGVARMEDRFATDVDDLWSALTDPERLVRWYGKVKGDLRLGGEFHFSIPDALDGTGRIDACEPPHRLLVTLRDDDPGPGQPEETVIEATLTADGAQTLLVVEERGLPLDLLPGYGAGVQMHVENLAAHIAGREPVNDEARWGELLPAYQELAEKVR